MRTALITERLVRFERVPDDAPFLRAAFWKTDRLAPEAVAAMAVHLQGRADAEAAHIRSDRFRGDTVAAHYLLHRLIEDSFAISHGHVGLGSTELGRPIIIAPASLSSVKVSLSHTRGLVAAAIARGYEVGIDVERISDDPDRLQISERLFSQDEAASLRGLGPTKALDQFTKLWTLKEAFVKAIGKGFWQPFRSFSIILPEPIGIVFHDVGLGDPDAWRFRTPIVSGFAAALAYSLRETSENYGLRGDPSIDVTLFS